MKVVFRKFKDGNKEIIALFPDDIDNNRYKIGSYMHVGQHGPACRAIIKNTTLAAPAEYEELLQELISIGYSDLRIMKRITEL